ncbi:MAG: hypothetical protein ACK5IR_11025 [Tropicimonas sp.]
MKASQVEGTRRLCRSLAEFPAGVAAGLERIGALIDRGDPSVSAEISALLVELLANAHRVCVIVNVLKPIIEAAVISDPDGRPGRLQ